MQGQSFVRGFRQLQGLGIGLDHGLHYVQGRWAITVVWVDQQLMQGQDLSINLPIKQAGLGRPVLGSGLTRRGGHDMTDRGPILLLNGSHQGRMRIRTESTITGTVQLHQERGQGHGGSDGVGCRETKEATSDE